MRLDDLGATIRLIRVLLPSERRDRITSLAEFGTRVARTADLTRAISKSTVSRWEHNEQRPRDRLLRAISALGREVGITLSDAARNQREEVLTSAALVAIERTAEILSGESTRAIYEASAATWFSGMDIQLSTSQIIALRALCSDARTLGPLALALVPGAADAPDGLSVQQLEGVARILVTAAAGEALRSEGM